MLYLNDDIHTEALLLFFVEFLLARNYLWKKSLFNNVSLSSVLQPEKEENVRTKGQRVLYFLCHYLFCLYFSLSDVEL